jgi:hypothetical protein
VKPDAGFQHDELRGQNDDAENRFTHRSYTIPIACSKSSG